MLIDLSLVDRFVEMVDSESDEFSKLQNDTDACSDSRTFGNSMERKKQKRNNMSYEIDMNLSRIGRTLMKDPSKFN